VRNMESLHQWILYRDGYWDREIERLRKTLLDDAAASQTPTSGNLAQ
jgi:hypothetical protein